MRRLDIINTIGEKYLVTNIENDEFSYQKALGRPITGHKMLDLKFTNNEVSVLVEVKKEGKKTGFSRYKYTTAFNIYEIRKRNK